MKTLGLLLLSTIALFGCGQEKDLIPVGDEYQQPILI